MKTVYGRVCCEYWSSAREIQVDVEDDATKEEIMAALWEAGVEAASVDVWQTDEDGDHIE